MKAIVSAERGTLSVVERPKPAAGPGEVVVRPTFVGASTAEVHAFLDAPKWTTPDGGGSVLGSELAGVVEEVGPDVAEVSAGDRVSIDPRHYCGTCMQCRAGHYSTCEREEGGLGVRGVDGALAQQVVVRARNCYPLPATVTDLQAALVPAVVRATHSVRAAGIGIGDNVGVFGLDDIGLATLQWARSATVGTIVAVDAVKRRRALAVRLSADLVLDPTTPDVSASMLGHIAEGLDSVFVSLNGQLPSDDNLLTLAFAVLRLKGSVVITQVLGNRAWEALSSPYLPLQREATVQNTGGVAYEKPLVGGRTAGDWTTTLHAFAVRRLDVDGLDLHVVPFDDVRTGSEVLDALRRVPGDASKILFSIGEVAA